MNIFQNKDDMELLEKIMNSENFKNANNTQENNNNTPAENKGHVTNANSNNTPDFFQFDENILLDIFQHYPS